MAVIRKTDIAAGMQAFDDWCAAAAPWGAIKILDGPASDPHNLTPPDVIELDPSVWLRVASGVTTWNEERAAGHITAVGERDDLSALLPLG